jgi:hypothetical protein
MRIEVRVCYHWGFILDRKPGGGTVPVRPPVRTMSHTDQANLIPAKYPKANPASRVHETTHASNTPLPDLTLYMGAFV